MPSVGTFELGIYRYRETLLDDLARFQNYMTAAQFIQIILGNFTPLWRCEEQNDIRSKELQSVF